MVNNNTMDLFGTQVDFIQTDITGLKIEAIVNPANTKLIMGGGVAGAIKRKGGKEIENEAMHFAPIELGQSILTQAGKLPANSVIHTATMHMDFKTDYDIIRKCARSVFDLCYEKGIKEVAIPVLGAGVGGLDIAMSSKITAQELFKAVRENRAPEKAVFVFYDDVALSKGLSARNYLLHLKNKTMQGPFITVDAVVFDKLNNPEKVVLIKRKNPPFGWALPGGFLDYGETVEDAVCRELKEETGLDYNYVRQLGVYSDPNRDERFHTITVAFYGISEGNPKADDDAQDAGWFSLKDLPEKIAFDHKQIIIDALERME